jgi:hypothetical protein
LLVIFCPKGPPPNAIVKKDYLRIKLSKRTPSLVAAGAAGDTCHLPPRQEAAGPAATAGGGRAGQNGNLGRDGTGQGRWAMPPPGEAAGAGAVARRPTGRAGQVGHAATT